MGEETEGRRPDTSPGSGARVPPAVADEAIAIVRHDPDPYDQVTDRRDVLAASFSCLPQVLMESPALIQVTAMQSA